MNEKTEIIEKESCHLLFGKFWEVEGVCSEILDNWEITFYVFSVISIILITIWVFFRSYLYYKTFITIKKETQQFKSEINNNIDDMKDKVQVKLDNFSSKLDRTNNDLNFLNRFFKKIVTILNKIRFILSILFKVFKFICFPLIFIYKILKKILILLFSSFLFFFKKINTFLFKKMKKNKIKMIK